MNPLYWFLLLDLTGCVMIALLLTALTRPAPDRTPPRGGDARAPGHCGR